MEHRMRDHRVRAVSGQIRMKVVGRVVSRLRVCPANGAPRLALGATGSMMIVPGPIGLFRREALERMQAENARAHGCEDGDVRFDEARECDGKGPGDVSDPPIRLGG
jgi:hypothetical protein